MRERQLAQIRFASICASRWGCDLLTALDRIAEAFRASYPN